MPVKPNCQYDNVVGEFNCSSCVQDFIIVPVLSWSTVLKISTLPFLFAFAYIIDIANVIQMSMHHQQGIDIVGTNSNFEVIHSIVLP
jgi:hypothetical protein